MKNDELIGQKRYAPVGAGSCEELVCVGVRSLGAMAVVDTTPTPATYDAGWFSRLPKSSDAAIKLAAERSRNAHQRTRSEGMTDSAPAAVEEDFDL